MKVTFVAEFNKEEDGYDGSVTVVRKDVSDLHDPVSYTHLTLPTTD